jgi:hypothetical protein
VGSGDVVSVGVTSGGSSKLGSGISISGGVVVAATVVPVAIGGVGSPAVAGADRVPTVCVTVCVTTEDVPSSVGVPHPAKTAMPMLNTKIDLLFMVRPVPASAANKLR